MELWKAAVLGLVQGLTEFLPVSSTAHLLVACKLLHEPTEGGFTTVIQLGTLFAVFVYFRRDIWAMLKALAADARALRFGTTPDSRLAWQIVVGSVPVGVLGLALNKWIKNQFYGDVVGIGLVAILFSLLMAAAEVWHKLRRMKIDRPELHAHDLTWREALWIGVWQSFALVPGASRSGTTISGALFAGLSRAAAARVSFLMSLPSVLAAGLKELFDNRHELLASKEQAVAIVVGTLAAGIVGYFSVAWLIRFLTRYGMGVFVAYRILFGAALIFGVKLGWL